jgi:D-alanyl-D-alanine carboxypeptidase/D-alanyl-D-alanine-endopeptidase (penicillin-binding protein 4)
MAVLLPLQAAGASLGVLVEDPASGEVLLSHHAQDLFAPASTQKVLTTAAVLRHLPGDRRLATTLVGPPVGEGGVLAGDLWLVGDGDPSLASARGQPGQQTPPGHSLALDDMARAVHAAGVRRITGGVVGDGRVLPGPAPGPGWSWDDAPYGYSALPAGLVVGEGTATLELTETLDGVVALLVPPTQEVRVRVERVVDVRPGLELLPLPGGEVLARWKGPVGLAPWREAVAVPDPARHAAEQLTAALRRAGVEVGGMPRSAGVLEGGPVAEVLYVRAESPTLRELCAASNQDSLNLHAEVLLRQLGRLAGAGPVAQEGLRLVGEVLREVGVDPARVRVVDGSGLSRLNLLSARALVAVLRGGLARDPGFADLLAVAGRSGTMRGRLVGTPAEGRVWAKTGGLTGHRTMAGVVETRGGRRLTFAVMVSGVVVPRQEVDAAVDRALLEVVGG